MAIKFKPLDWAESNYLSSPAYSLSPAYQARVYLGSEILVYDLVRLAIDDYRYSVFFNTTKPLIDKDFVTKRIDDLSFGSLEDAKIHAEYHYQEQMTIRLCAIMHYELEGMFANNES